MAVPWAEVRRGAELEVRRGLVPVVAVAVAIWSLMKRDNVVAKTAATLHDLGINDTSIEQAFESAAV